MPAISRYIGYQIAKNTFLFVVPADMSKDNVFNFFEQNICKTNEKLEFKAINIQNELFNTLEFMPPGNDFILVQGSLRVFKKWYEIEGGNMKKIKNISSEKSEKYFASYSFDDNKWDQAYEYNYYRLDANIYCVQFPSDWDAESVLKKIKKTFKPTLYGHRLEFCLADKAVDFSECDTSIIKDY